MENPVRRLNNAKFRIKFMIAAAALLVFGYIREVIKSSGGTVSTGVEVVLTIGAILVMALFIEVLGEIISDYLINSPRIRRIILKSNYIEGTWLDTVSNKQFALITIKFENGSYVVKGEYYDSNLMFLGRWKSQACFVGNGVLEYHYLGDYDTGEAGFMGFASYDFRHIGSSSIPKVFTGFFVDYSPEGNKKHLVKGEKLPKDKLEELNSLNGEIKLMKEWAESREIMFNVSPSSSLVSGKSNKLKAAGSLI